METIDSIKIEPLVENKLRTLRQGQTLDVHGVCEEEAQLIIRKYSGEYIVRGPLDEGEGNYALNIQVRGGRL